MGKSEIGSRIADLRKKAGLSQEALGEKIGIGQNTLSRYEIGTASKIPVDDVERLADVFGVSCDYLIRGLEPENVDIGKATGFGNETIEKLRVWNKGGKCHFIDYMLSDARFEILLMDVEGCVSYKHTGEMFYKIYLKGEDKIFTGPEDLEEFNEHCYSAEKMKECGRAAGYYKYETVECFKEILSDYVKNVVVNYEVYTE